MSASSNAEASPIGASSSRRAWLWRGIGLGVSLVALAIVFVSVDVGAALDSLARATLLPLVLVLGVLALQLVIRAWRWRILLPLRADGHPVPILRAIPPLLVGYLGNAILPARLGEPIRAVLVARREGLSALASFGATMLERLIDVTTLAVIGLVAALALGAATWVVGVGAVTGLAGLVILALLVTVGFSRLTDLAASLLERLGLGARTQRLQRWAEAFATGIDRGRDIRRLSRAILLSVVAWVLDASIFLLAGWSLGLDLALPQAVLIGAVAVLSTAIPAAPGYVGTFELATTATAVALGVPDAQALALAVLVHVVTVIPMAFAGAIALLVMGGGLSGLATEAEEVEHAGA